MEQVNNLLTNTNELKGCLESTFSAVSELLNNRSPARRPINATPPRPTHTKKLIRNILHKSHSQFKHLILAQRKEIAPRLQRHRKNNRTAHQSQTLKMIQNRKGRTHKSYPDCSDTGSNGTAHQSQTL